jgi:hypothetical protein
MIDITSLVDKSVNYVDLFIPGGIVANKRKGSYGVRYSPEQQAKIVADWIAEQTAEAPRTQQQFCKDANISPLTLNKWLKASGNATAVKAKRGRPAGKASSAKAGKAAKAKPGKAAKSAKKAGGLSIADLTAQIADHRDAIAKLKQQIEKLIAEL